MIPKITKIALVEDLLLFDSSNAVLGMAFTHPSLEKRFVLPRRALYCIANKTKTKVGESRLKTSKVVKKGGKKVNTKFEKGGLSGLQWAFAGFTDIFPMFTSAFNKFPSL